MTDCTDWERLPLQSRTSGKVKGIESGNIIPQALTTFHSEDFPSAQTSPMSGREDTQPVFPPEIEEIIFSLCIQQGLENSKTLIFVAKRVYEWYHQPYDRYQALN